MSIPPSASVAGGAQPPASEALVFYIKYIKDVSLEFDEFQVKTHLCKLRCCILYVPKTSEVDL